MSSSRSTPLRRRGAALMVAVAAVVLAAGCGGEGGSANGAGTSRATAGAAGRPLTLYTHCGVLSGYVDGRLWLADPPLHDGSHNPLPGWDANDTRRVVGHELSDGEAEFRADSGEVAHFCPGASR